VGEWGFGGVAGAGALVGRAEELAAIVGRARQACDGRPGVVWIEGEAGAGKTALLRAAVGVLAGEFHVVRAQADELAAEVSFDVVGQLGVRDAQAPFPAGLELIGRWAGQPDGRPVLAVVEDLHWADAESRLALLTAARRLDEDRVLMLVTSRLDPPAADGWERLRFDPDRCLRVPVGPLSAADVTEMARGDGVDLSPAAAQRLLRHTAGHALYVRTLLSELPAGVLAAAQGPLPAPRSLAATTTARLAELPRRSRELAAALAVLNQRVPLALAAQVAEAAEPAEALDGLLTTGFVASAVSDGQTFVEFAHPLYRTAVYGDLAPSLRQRLHRTAGAALDGDASLAHRVAATEGTDQSLADEAHRVARVEAERHRNVLAARYLLWASRLSPDRHDAQGRLLRAARLLIEAGHLNQADGLRDQMEACEPSPMRDYVLGLLALEHYDLPAAERLLAGSAAQAGRELPDWETDLHREAVAGALAQLALVYCITLRGEQAVDAAAKSLALRPKEPDVERMATFSAATGHGVADGPVAALDYLATRLPADPDRVAVGDLSLLALRGIQGLQAGRLGAAATDLRAAIRLGARHPWDLSSRAAAHGYLAQLLFHAGAWDEALAQARVALSLTFDQPQVWVERNAHAAITWVLASRGSWQEAERHLDAVRDLVAAQPFPDGATQGGITEAICALARHEPDQVVAHLSPLAGIGGDQQLSDAMARTLETGMGIIWWPWLIRALLDRGETGTAASQLNELERVTKARQLDFRARTTGLRAVLAAQRGDHQQAVALGQEAVALAGPDDPLLDRAQLHHSLGQLLAATGDRDSATAQLRAAHQLLATVQAEAFTERLAADLRSAGQPRTRRSSRRPDELTTRENDVATLAAQGLTTPEIADQLYLSVNTVEYHLRNVFTKLGINSRRELRQRHGQETP
jgi:DNA-binding CsgD family transcriptional regulator